jgi:hypothetical protein
MSAVVRDVEEEDGEGRPIWRLLLRCGHEATCGRHSTTPPTSHPGPCRACRRREVEARKWIKRKAKMAAAREAAQRQPTEAERAWEAKIKQLMTIE